ncbi:MAG: hypothetical protein CL607_09495 [Anaerolineaceae bacterium]|nr:hypothetical protein [Anaerolineaceae bacterium]
MVAIVPKLQINSLRLQTDFTELSQIGQTANGGITRVALSNEDLEARAWFANQIEEAGFFVRDDEVGNLSGVMPSTAPNARTLLIGSHLDTVPNGGQYDGSIGVLAGLECMRTIRDAGIELPFHVEVISFTDEEGWWQSFFGSMGLTGMLKSHHINDAQQDNAAFRAALYRAGILVSEVDRAIRPMNDLLSYLELHIEQSSRLERAHTDIGVISGVVGRSAYVYTFYGEGTSAATTHTNDRRDALQGAALFITKMHALIREEYPEGIVNCGNIEVQPGTFNVIPAEARLRVECRHQNQATLHEIESRLVEMAHTIADTYRLSVKVEEMYKRDVAIMNDHLMELIESICDEEHLSHERMVSYAGHDAQILSPFTPSAMIFIPSKDGISHNPREYTEWHDIEHGANVLLRMILRLAAEMA